MNSKLGDGNSEHSVGQAKVGIPPALARFPSCHHDLQYHGGRRLSLMELAELKRRFRDVGLLLVEAEPFPDTAESESVYVSGSLDEYLEAMKALGIAVVFVNPQKLEDGDFRYSPDEDELTDADSDAAQDLCSVNPELHFFKQYIGQIGQFTFLAGTLPHGVMFVLEEEWYGRFWDSWQAGMDTLEGQSADERDALEGQRNQRRDEVAALLERLASDDKFARLPTQRAMLAYAKDRIPELGEWQTGELRSAIAELKAKIDARDSR